LFDVTGERRFGRASADGYRYVASRYLDTAQNWPVLGEPIEGVPGLGPSMTAWCHGAPGVTLAISLGSADTVYAKLLDQLEPSLRTTAQASPHMADHLCCGNMGRCEALFTTGRRLMRREAVEGSRRLARVVIARARKAGHFCLTANGFEYRIFDPASSGASRGSATRCCGWRRHRACRRSPPSKRRRPVRGRRDPLWFRSTRSCAVPPSCRWPSSSRFPPGGLLRSSHFRPSRASGSRTRRRRCRRRA
jgi:hypothetical protein